MMDVEEFEHIPWSQLEERERDFRAKALYGVALLVVAVVAGVVLARTLRSPEPGVVVPIPTEAGAAAGEPVATAPPGEDPPPAAPEVDLLTEADLMAVLPEDDRRLVASWAEVLVTQYFTDDGDPASDLVAVEDWSAPVPEGGSHYVEWARTVRLEAIADGSYVATVVFGAVASIDGARFERRPVRAVDVELERDGTVVRLAGLPRPALVETAPSVVSVRSGPIEGVPESVVAAALDRASHLAEPVEAVGARIVGTRWRLVVTVADPSGVTWPVEVEVDPLGSSDE